MQYHLLAVPFLCLVTACSGGTSSKSQTQNSVVETEESTLVSPPVDEVVEVLPPISEPTGDATSSLGESAEPSVPGTESTESASESIEIETPPEVSPIVTAPVIDMPVTGGSIDNSTDESTETDTVAEKNETPTEQTESENETETVGNNVSYECPLAVSLEVSNAWTGGFDGALTITNLSAQTLVNWQAEISTNFGIGSFWDGQVADNGANRYTLSGNTWNADLAVAASVTIGFVGQGSEPAIQSDACITNNDTIAETGPEQTGNTEDGTTEVVSTPPANSAQPLLTEPGDYMLTDGNVVGTYFVEWGIYGRDYHVADLPADQLTHLLYGFIAVCGENDSLLEANPSGYSTLQRECADQEDYTVTIFDRFAALEKSYPGDKWDDPIKGNFGQLARLKAAHPDLVILPSVGGWTLSDPFFYFANDAALRARFVESVVDFLRTYTFFDGVDIDWEYPGGGGANTTVGSPDDATGYAELMKDLRVAFNALSDETGRTYQITSAVGAAQSKIDQVDYRAATPYMDYVFAMTYDFYGAWSDVLGHQTGLYPSAVEKQVGFNTDAAITGLLNAGVPASKLVVGVAMYGRGWKNVSALDGSNPFSGSGGGAAAGTWEAGIQDYKDLVENYLGGSSGSGINGFAYGYDEIAEAPYLWNESTGTLISYDDPRSVIAKGNYARSRGLAGLFSWEIDGDNGDLLDAMHEGMGHTKIAE